ncbi:hypothetical protein, partial [Streptococcus uberis]|uniref:hypothetical protein n=1 Tax=Streptococcus uberis TaxID=1349 RepID=UPI0012B61F05
MSKNKKKYRCVLCHSYYKNSKMSEEHYPAKNVGNFDIVNFDLIKSIDFIRSPEINQIVQLRVNQGEKKDDVLSEIFDTHLATDLYPKGRTSRTLCIKCNTFLGKYDESYKKFFLIDGNPQKVKGFQEHTKLEIVKSIFGKFLSIPETKQEEFDFLNFVKNKEEKDYSGIWKIYFIKRNFSTDLLGFKDIRTGKLTYDEGVVYEMSDEKFIYNLMNFNKHAIYETVSYTHL